VHFAIPRSGGSETPIAKVQRVEIGRSNYPAKQGYNTTQHAAIKFPKLALGFIPVILEMAHYFYTPAKELFLSKEYRKWMIYCQQE
jgi:hypothetical protein